MQLSLLCPDSQFDQIRLYTTKLFSELFGETAIPSEDAFRRIQACFSQADNRHQAYVVEENGNTLAYFTLAESCSAFAHGHYGILNELWVAPECRGHGIGGFIVEQIKAIAESRFWLRIDVTAPPAEKWLKSVEFYEGQGFIHTGKKLKLIID